MKKILILGGASVHYKLVEAAKEMGLYTIVTDYLEDSPAKKIADESWMLNIMDVDAIVEKCRESNVEAVIAAWLDPCQRPYYEISNKLGVPCYGTWEQFFKMTDKHAFKQMCRENGVDIIPEYSENDLDQVEYPVLSSLWTAEAREGRQCVMTEKHLKKPSCMQNLNPRTEISSLKSI